MRLGISVIVCTYNGAALLPETIRHIAQLQVRPDIDWEFIIIDNASADDSAQVALTEWSKYKSTVRFSLLSQPRQGLTYARELALEKSRYEFVLFCDDDNWLSPDYINKAYDLMCAHPSIGVLGGYGELAFETTPPLWAVGLRSLASGPQAKTSGKVRQNVVYGAGFIMRRTAFNRITRAGFRPMLTDRKGQSLSAGGDYELCYAIALAGYDIWYEETLKFRHFMPASRINWNYRVRLYEEGAKSLEVLIPYRVRVNMNCQDPKAFELQYIRVYLSHVKKLVPLLVQKVWLQHGSERAKANMLKLIALRAKLRSLRNYATMKANFQKIIKFEQEELQYNRQLERPFPTDAKPLRVH